MGSVGVSLSGGISLLGCSRYIEIVMADYSFAYEIEFVPKLYLTSSSIDYYYWEDDMEDFFFGSWTRFSHEGILCKAHIF